MRRVLPPILLSFSFFSLHFSLFIIYFFIRGLARGHLTVRRQGATLSPLDSFFQRGRGRRSFFDLCQIFWGISQRRRTCSLSVTWRGLFLSISCCMMLRALANLSIFSFCSFRSWRTSLHPSASGEAPKYTFPIVFSKVSIKFFTSASYVEERVGIVGNECILGPKSYPSSLRPNLRLDGHRIHGQTGLPRSHTGSDTCVQYALPD